jgi:hypothetical protein
LTDVTEEELDFLVTTFHSVVVEEYKDGAKDGTIPLGAWQDLQEQCIRDFDTIQEIKRRMA